MKKHKKLPKPCKESRSGATLLTVALSLVALFSFAALSIDVGNVYVQRERIQEAGDAAALAAVRDWATGSSAATIDQVGRVYAGANGVLTSEVVSVSVGRWDNTAKTFTAKNPLASSDVPAVQVTLRRTVPMAFAKVIGTSQMTPRTVSVAIAALANAVSDWLPFGACVDSLTEKHTKCEPIDLQYQQFCQGLGNFVALNVGTNGYIANIRDGVPSVLRIGDVVPTQPFASQQAGELATRQGLQQRMVGVSPYNCTANSPAPTDKRLFIIPLLTGNVGAGQPVTIRGFWVFAVDNAGNSQQFTAKYLWVFNGSEVDPSKPPVAGLANGLALVK